jgi:hypothetical protein
MLVLAGLAVGIGLLVVNINGLRFAAGWTGDTGRLATVSCAVIGTDGQQHEDCHGNFISADGGIELTSASGRADWDTAAIYPAQLAADGESATAVGEPAVTGAVAGILFGLFAIALSSGVGTWTALQRYRATQGGTIEPPARLGLVSVWVALSMLTPAIILWAIAHRSG